MSKKEKRMLFLGVVGVDSGQLVIADPGYIGSEWNDNDDVDAKKYKGEFSYSGCCNATLNKPYSGQLNFKKGHAGAGVAVGGFGGDGLFNVFAEQVLEDGWWRTIKMEVRFE